MTDDHSHDHHAHDVADVEFGVLTVSSSRTAETDAGGDAVAGSLEEAGQTVAARDLVPDDATAIREGVETLIGREGVDAVVTTGGTGLTPDDVTVDALQPIFDREIPGFGEQFRARSVEEVGLHGMLTRATAGVADGVPIFCLPGSEQAASFGTSELVAPVVGHVVGLTAVSESEHGTTDRHGESE